MLKAFFIKRLSSSASSELATACLGKEVLEVTEDAKTDMENIDVASVNRQYFPASEVRMLTLYIACLEVGLLIWPTNISFHWKQTNFL